MTSAREVEGRYDSRELLRFASAALEAAGMRPSDARALADHVLWCEVRGVGDSGVRRLPQLLARMRAGGTDPRATPRCETNGWLHIVDGQHAWGEVVAAEAVQRCIETARTTGVGAAVVHSTTTPGDLGYFAAKAVSAGMVGVAVANTPPLMPAWGGAQRVLGNQPFAVGAPAGRHADLLLDITMSVVTPMEIHDHEQRGEALPEQAALAPDGSPTTDPATALTGMLLPVGGHRGYALAVMWEVLTGVLAGGPRLGPETTPSEVVGEPQGASLFLLVLDVTSTMPVDRFRTRVDQLIDHLQTSRAASPGAQVAVPGGPEAAHAGKVERVGVPLSAEIVAVMEAVAGQCGIGPPVPLQPDAVGDPTAPA